MRNLIYWFKCYRTIKYKRLYRMVYGDERDDQDKGLLREFIFKDSISGMWAVEAKRLQPLLQEAQDLLRANGLETGTMKASRKVLEKYGIKK